MNNEITLDGNTYRLVSTAKKARLWVLTNGWVLKGSEASRSETEVVLENVSTVRRWGTTSGLGQLASGGGDPTLDSQPDTTVQLSNLIFSVETE